MAPEQHIGFIGTGIMGYPMAENLLKAGYEMTVHTRTKSKAENLLKQGAEWADTPGQLANNVDVLITCVTDTPDVENVLFGKNGVMENARGGLICIDTSTISPTETQKFSRQLEGHNVTLLDAPISGGQNGAIEGKLSIMVGGPKETFEKVKPIFNVLGKTITHCGPTGSGQITKLANQIMVVHTLMSMAEGLAFAEKAGLDLKTTLNVTTAGAGSSKSLEVLGTKVISDDFSPAFMVELQLKDLRLVLEYADQIDQPLPGTALVKQLLGVLKAKDRGRDGTQSLIDVIRELGQSD